MANGLNFPTILVVAGDEGHRAPLVVDLQSLGYLVLVAGDAGKALNIVRMHSRPIHVLLASENEEGRTLVATLKQYRPNMAVLFVRRSNGDEQRLLLRVRKLITPLAKSAFKPIENLVPKGGARVASQVA